MRPGPAPLLPSLAPPAGGLGLRTARIAHGKGCARQGLRAVVRFAWGRGSRRWPSTAGERNRLPVRLPAEKGTGADCGGGGGQLLADMDGFKSTEGIVVIAATNFPEVLDKALMRCPPPPLDTAHIPPRARTHTHKTHPVTPEPGPDQAGSP